MQELIKLLVFVNLLQGSFQERIFGLSCCRDVEDLMTRVAELEAKVLEQDGRITAAQNTLDVRGPWIAVVDNKLLLLDGRLTDAETKNAQQDTRLTAAEGKNTEQDGRLTIVENKNVDQDVAIVALQAGSNTPAPVIFPINAVYIQYTSTDIPSMLWPTYTWTEISAQFQGSFFRAVTPTQPTMGTIQEESCPKITLFTANAITSNAIYPYLMQPGDPAGVIATGAFTGGTGDNVFVNLEVVGYDEEVRPKNVPVRIWKRTA